MAKFKVGDRVNLLDCDADDNPGTVHAVYEKNIHVLWEGNDSTTAMSADKLFLIVSADAPSSPIRTVMRREIVPGAYGIVNISRPAKPMLLPKARDYTTEELRAAAKLFSELADVLDENAGAM